MIEVCKMKRTRPIAGRVIMKKTFNVGSLSPTELLLDGSNNGGLNGGHNLLLLLLLAGNEGGGGKSENSDGLHNFLVCC